MKRTVLAVGVLGVFGCADDNTATPRPTPDQIPEWSSVVVTTATDGFWDGKIRTTTPIEAFAITTYPITVGRYRQCVNAGACTKPSLDVAACSAPNVGSLHGPTYDLSEDLPITCTTPSQAKEYCAWQGAQLPTEAQWLAAVRGAAPRRYSWGDTIGDCEKHPEGHSSNGACSQSTDYVVAKHPKGASPAGVQDALLTPAELLRADNNAAFGACRVAEFCTVTGLGGGSIDWVAAVPKGSLTKMSEFQLRTYGFRCVKGVSQ